MIDIKLALHVTDLLFREFHSGKRYRDLSQKDVYRIAYLGRSIASEVDMHSDSFRCDSCNRRVSGEGEMVGRKLFCPGCFNHQTLLYEVMRKGLGKDEEQSRTWV